MQLEPSEARRWTPQAWPRSRDCRPGPFQVLVSADGFRPATLPVNVRRGANTATATLAVAISEQITVADQAADDRRDNGFTQTLTADEIDALSDDPDEMAEQLAQMAGPGAQVFVDGFRGGRLPPKDQIQQIRFNSNSFSAEYHEAGMVRVEVITRPGMGGWRGRGNFGFRDESLNARNAFSATKEPTQQERYGFSFQGPLAKGKTGISMSVDGNNAYDSRTIRAQAPTDVTVNGLARNTTVGVNANFRVDHSMGQGNQIRAEYQRRHTDRGDLGVGDFDLPERAYDTDMVNDTFRLRNTRVIGKKLFSELKFEFTSSNSETLPFSTAPTVRVNDAFTAGGAGQSGDRSSREIEIAQNFDFTVKRKHAMRAGVLFEAGWWNSTQQQNGNGTYVFTSNDAYNLSQPSTYTVRVGDPLVEYSQVKAGWFLQDDVRLAKTFSVSLGMRQEIQTQVNDWLNIAPRAAFTWNASRKTTVRGGYGIFYDWYDSSLYEQTLRVDGEHQVDVVVTNPSYPVGAGTGDRLPASIIRSSTLAQPIIQQASVGLERPLTSVGGTAAGLHDDARLQRAAIGERERAGRWRPAGSDGRQHHRDPGQRQPRQRSADRGGERAASAAAPLHERDVSAPELAQPRRLGDEPAVGQHESRRGLGAVGAGRAAPPVRDVQHAAVVRRARGFQHAGGLGHALQRHHWRGRQR